MTKQDWQPIETAPTDRRHVRAILVYNKTGHAHWEVHCGYPDGFDFIDTAQDECTGWSPEDYDLWLDLPALPKPLGIAND